MNYKNHYDRLIERARTRQINGYVEYHHIIPKCLGGTNDKINLVPLTPEEHYVAHQLLVKMYPKNHSLAKAAAMMIPSRPSNKLYGWVKKRVSVAMSDSQAAEKNSQYGSVWIHNKKLKISKKIKKNTQIDDGWEFGRVIKFDRPQDRTKEEYLQDRKKDAMILAYRLYEEFLQSNFDSVTSFAKSINTTQPRLSILWKRYVKEYNEIKRHGKSFKKS